MAKSTHKLETSAFLTRNTSVPAKWCAACKDLDRFFTAIWIKIYNNLKVSNFLMLFQWCCTVRVPCQCTFLCMVSNIHYTEIQKQWFWIQDCSSEVNFASPWTSVCFVYLYGKDKVTVTLLYKSLSFPSLCATTTTHKGSHHHLTAPVLWMTANSVYNFTQGLEDICLSVPFFEVCIFCMLHADRLSVHILPQMILALPSASEQVNSTTAVLSTWQNPQKQRNYITLYSREEWGEVWWETAVVNSYSFSRHSLQTTWAVAGEAGTFT